MVRTTEHRGRASGSEDRLSDPRAGGNDRLAGVGRAGIEHAIDIELGLLDSDTASIKIADDSCYLVPLAVVETDVANDVATLNLETQFLSNRATGTTAGFAACMYSHRPTIKGICQQSVYNRSMAKPNTVEEYLEVLTSDRREALEAIRKTILKNIDAPFEEGIQYGMIGYYVPHSVFPDGYHCDPKLPLPFGSIASQKKHIGLYFFCVYMDEDLQKWFVDAWKKTGKKLDMGKSCVRVKTLEDIPLEVIAALFKRVKAKAFIKTYQASRETAKK